MPAANAVSAKAAQPFCPVPSHQGLLEPVARKAGTAGSEGTPARQRAGVTRRVLLLGHPRQAIRRATFTSVKELTTAIGVFIDHWNDHPRPFTWTKDADEILASIQRAKTKQTH